MQSVDDAIFIIIFICLLFIILGYILGKIQLSFNEETNGCIGEIEVRELLNKYCNNKNAHVLNHLTLRLEDGLTSQIDHILVSTKGIFVIETKHFSGWIFADPKSKYWMQCLYSIKNQFQNPLFQNYKHVKAVQKLFLFLKPYHIHNMLVFSGEAEFKTDQPKNVFYIEDLISAIEKYPDNILNLNYIQFCIGRLEYLRLELTNKTDIEHHAFLNRKFGLQ